MVNLKGNFISTQVAFGTAWSLPCSNTERNIFVREWRREANSWSSYFLNTLSIRWAGSHYNDHHFSLFSSAGKCSQFSRFIASWDIPERHWPSVTFPLIKRSFLPWISPWIPQVNEHLLGQLFASALFFIGIFVNWSCTECNCLSIIVKNRAHHCNLTRNTMIRRLVSPQVKMGRKFRDWQGRWKVLCDTLVNLGA